MASRRAAADARAQHMERLLRVATCLAASGYCAQVGQLLVTARAFRGDTQLWTALLSHRSSTPERTALMHAAMVGDAPRVKFLLDCGADVETTDPVFGDSPLMLACSGGRSGAARVLVEDGGAMVNAVGGNDAKTALMCACENGHLETVRNLVESWGADVNAATTSDGATALMWASDGGHLDIVRCLVDNGGDANAARDAHDGKSVLMWASEKGHVEIVRYLVEEGGANVQAARTDTGITALMSACRRGHLETARLLLQFGANKHALTLTGQTAHALASGFPLVQAALI